MAHSISVKADHSSSCANVQGQKGHVKQTAAKKNHVKRFVMIGAAFSDQPSYWAKQNIKPYYIAKHLADKALIRSGLEEKL